jgi:uncharacterized LabA/DUF88 family protein
LRTIVYADGFNLYYRALRSRPEFKWLNVKRLAENVLTPQNNVVAVKYYTARVSARVDPDAPKRQQIYFDALSTIPEVEIVQGNFLVKKTYAALVGSTNGKPVFQPWPSVVRIVKTEEKGSDVNLGSHLVRDAFTDQYDVAAVITNDTDLVEPIRIAIEEVGKVVGIIAPVDKPSADLKAVSSFLRHIRPGHLAASQFPDVVQRQGGAPLQRPASWNVVP